MVILVALVHVYRLDTLVMDQLSIPASDSENDKLTDDLIEWLKSNGAFIDERFSVQHTDPSDPTSMRGLFAAHGPFEKGETLFSIPDNLIYDGQPRAVKKNADEIWRDDQDRYCGTAYEIHHAMQTGDTPYGRYLAHQPRRYVPGYWSPGGRELLGTILGDQLSSSYRGTVVEDRVPEDWTNYCRGATSDELEVHASMLVIARADGSKLIPLYDMVNHRNGHWYNCQHDRNIKKEHFSLVTNRRVEQGEEFYLPYNTCTICGSRVDTWGTIELFEDYGFVEPFPQRYIFPSVRLKFALDEKKSSHKPETAEMNADDENESDGLVFKWYVPPSQKGLDFLQTETERLQKVGKMKDKLKLNVNGEQAIQESEWNACWMLYDAMLFAFQAAIEHAPAVSAEVWTMGSNAWYKDRSGIEPPNRFY